MKSAVAAAHADNVVHLRTRSPVQGLHFMGEWYGCPRTDSLKRAEHLRQVGVQLAREAGFDVVSSLFQQFQPNGVVGTILMADAHIAIHTWPDTGFVAVDFYACHLSPGTRERAAGFLANLRQVLRPVWVNASEISRGVGECNE